MRECINRKWLVGAASTLVTLFVVMSAFSADDGAFGKYTDLCIWSAVSSSLESSCDHATVGETCAKVTFPRGKNYPGIRLEKYKTKTSFDLSNASAILIDCFNPGELVAAALKLKSPSKKLTQPVSIPAEQSTISINLDEFANQIDMAEVTYLNFFVFEPAEDVILFLDNIRVAQDASMAINTGNASLATGLVVRILGDMEKPAKDTVSVASNPTFSPDGKSILLAGAKNETVACQILLQSGIKREDIHVEIESANTNTPRPYCSLFFEHYHFVRHGAYTWGPGRGGILPDRKYYPDALIPFTDPYSKSSNEIAQGFTLDPENGPNQALWLDVFIPANMPAGKWNAIVKITQGEKLLAELPLTLTVFPFSLPNECHVDAFGEIYRECGEMIDSGVKFKVNPEKDWKVYKHYLQMAHAHRFLALHRVENGPIPRTSDGTFPYRERLPWEDFSLWERYYGQVFDGSLYTLEQGYIGPSPNTPPSFFIAPFAERWYGGKMLKQYLDENDGKLSDADQAYFEDCAKRFWIAAKSNGWDNVRFYAYILDEVDGAVDISDGGETMAVRDSALLSHSLMKSIQEALDAGSGGKNIDLIWTSHANAAAWKGTEADLLPFIRMWVPNGHAVDVGFYTDVKQSNHDATVWFYHSGQPAVGNHTVNQTGIDLRTWGLLCWKYRLDGSFWWSMMSFGGAPDDPYNNPIYKKGEDRWGNGVLFYPGTKLDTIGFPNIAGPVSSMRMKAYRRGLEDYEYLWLLSEKDGNKDRADLLLNAVLRSGFKQAKDRKKGDWSTDPDEWYHFRQEVAERIANN